MRSRESVARLHPFGLRFSESVVDKALPTPQHLLVARSVTRHAAYFTRLCHLAPEFVLREKVTAIAMDPRLKHRAWHRFHALASDAGIKVCRGRMPVPVAGTAVVRGRGHGVYGFVLNLDVAIRAFDLVIGHVSLMHELGLVVATQSRRIVVASVAAFARNLARTLNHVRVARRALHVEALNVAVVETQIRLGDYLFRHFVTQGAAPGALIELLVLKMT